jgi:hypothetical protein
VEREKWEEALKVEREERESEKAVANKRYELLKSHLWEVEETLETAGWITNNVSHRLGRFISKTESVGINRIRKCSTGSSYATS